MIALGIIMSCRLLGVGPFGIVGTASILTGTKLIIGIVVNFILGALMMVGVGLYAPCMALCLLLGLSADMAFPIMMGSCAFLMNVSVFKFVKEGKYDRRATLCLMFAGALGAYAAYLLINYCFDLTTLTYIVCVVMFITAGMYIKDAKKA